MGKDNLWLWVKTTSHYFYEIHQLGQYFYEYGRLTVYEIRRLCHFYKNYEYRRRLTFSRIFLDLHALECDLFLIYVHLHNNGKGKFRKNLLKMQMIPSVWKGGGGRGPYIATTIEKGPHFLLSAQKMPKKSLTLGDLRREEMGIFSPLPPTFIRLKIFSFYSPDMQFPIRSV